MVTHISRTPDETVALGRRWGESFPAGTLVGLCGDLGAGKTQLVRGIAAGLGYRGRVSSPTFALVNEYRGGRVAMYHLDLYRLDTPEQVRSAGLDPYLDDPESLVVIEWFERLEPLFTGWPSTKVNRVRVSLEVVDELTRRIVYEDSLP